MPNIELYGKLQQTRPMKSMLRAEESKNQGAIKHIFLRQLPKRLGSIQKRGVDLAKNQWDINAHLILLEEVQFLATECAQLELPEIAEQLGSLQSALQPPIEHYAAPDAAASDLISAQAERLAHALEKSAAPIGNIEIAPQTETQTNGAEISLAVFPPLAFISRFFKSIAPMPIRAMAPGKIETFRRFDLSDESEDLPTDIFEPGIIINESAAPPPLSSPTFAGTATPRPPVAQAPTAKIPVAKTEPMPSSPVPAPELAPPARKEAENIGHQRIYHLTRHQEAFAKELDQFLEQGKYQLYTLEDVKALGETMLAIAPNLVIVDPEFQNQLDEIGQALNAVRSRTSQRIYSLVLSKNKDVAMQLKAMRSGADAFLTQGAGVNDIGSKIMEILGANAEPPYRVLIIEDDRAQAVFAESILRKAGIETKMVNDPLLAMEAMEAFKPELVLMDLNMPTCNGMELTQLIRERDEFVSTPIVFLSGEHDADKRFDALSVGGDDYLEKPIRPKYLISAVTNRIRRIRTLAKRSYAPKPEPWRERTQAPAAELIDRKHLLDQVANTVNQSQQHKTAALFFIGIDGASALREQLGPSSFDTLIAQTGLLILKHLGENAKAARHHETSLLALYLDAEEKQVESLSNEIRHRVENHLFNTGKKSLSLSVNIGAADLKRPWRSALEAVLAAEQAYAAATGSPAPARQDEPPKKSPIQATTVKPEEGQLANALGQALGNNRIQLLFQPIAALHGNGEEQFQVLVHVPDAKGQHYPASEIFPPIADTELTYKLDRWLISRSLLILAEHHLNRNFKLFISQSVNALLNVEHLEWVESQLAAYRVQQAQLIMQFRYSDTLIRLRHAINFFAAAKRQGLSIAVSGFEASLQAVQVLNHLNLDYLKIAPKYSANPTKFAQELKQLISVAHAREIQVVATMIADAQAAASLWSVGVDLIQGDFVQEPSSNLDFDFTASAL